MMILVYITCADEKEANVVSEHLLNKKLIACANIFPIKSIYRWKGEIAAENEVVVVAKSIEGKFNEIKKEVKKVHSYKVPCIIKINAEANEEYENWVGKEVKK
ncbi:MAG: divalent-cation tolerance protein CutA [Candidatus Woesearchaeota archaeon]